MAVERAAGGTSLIDVLDRVLDKGGIEMLGRLLRQLPRAGQETPASTD